MPPGFRDVMRAMEIQSYRVFFFEKRDDFFLPPEAYPREALACITTHDLHTLAGWWSGHDIEVRREIGMLERRARSSRIAPSAAHERRRLLGLLADHGLLPAELAAGDARRGGGAARTCRRASPSRCIGLSRARRRASSRCRRRTSTGAIEQVNIPGTIDEHPNWRRKLAVDIEELPDAAALPRHHGGAARRAAEAAMIRPTATYRLQFRGGMTLRQGGRARRRYFAALGVSHLYASPIFTATPGSTHGYDVADFSRDRSGDRRRWTASSALSAALKAERPRPDPRFRAEPHGREPLQSLVARHPRMGRRTAISASISTSTGRRRSWSCRRSASPMARRSRQGRFGLDLDDRDGGISFTYYDLRLPLTPPSYARILARIEAEPFPELARRFAVARPETGAPAKEELAALARDPAVAAADRRGDRRDGRRPRGAARAARGAGLARRLLARGARGPDLPPLLRDRRPGRRARRAAARLRRRARAPAGAGRGRARRRRPARPHRRPRRSEDLSRSACRRRSAATSRSICSSRKSSGRARRCGRPGRSPAPPATSSSQALAGLFVDPASEAALTAAYEAFLGGRVDYATMVRETKRRIARPQPRRRAGIPEDLAKAHRRARSDDARLRRRQPAPRHPRIRRRAPGLSHLRQCRGPGRDRPCADRRRGGER